MRSARDRFPHRARRATATGSSPSTATVATLTMDVDEKGGLLGGYELKLNSYDLGVDIELADAIERLRFEHPEVKVVVLRSGKDRVFCAGANIRMLASATHAHKVNFCKFTNETRNGIEDASAHSGQKYLCVVNGTAAGGGYELALACDHIMLVDDGSAVGVAARAAAARGAARHRRAHPRHRQAQGAARPRRRVLHHRGRREGQARGRLAAGRRGDAALEARRSGRARAPKTIAAASRRTRSRSRAASRSPPIERKRSADAQRVQIRVGRVRRARTVSRPSRCAARTSAAPARCRRHGARRAPRSGRCSSRASSTMRSSTSG